MHYAYDICRYFDWPWIGETYVLCNYVLNSIVNELIVMNDDIIKQGDARAARSEEDPAIINSRMIGTGTYPYML